MTGDNEWAVILGVSTGTGAAIALEVAGRCALNVYGLHRGYKPEAAERVAADVRGLGREMTTRVGNAGSAEAARMGVAALKEQVGPRRVRLLVHSIANASLGHLAVGPAPVDAARIEKTFSSMAHSFVYWARELHQQDMLAPSARLLALGNPVTDSLADDLGLIAAAKSALEIYVRVLAMELGPLGHRVNLLKFGLVDTRAAQVAFAPEAWDQVMALAASVTPAGRLCTVEEVARFVAVLVGPAAEWFNGATIDFTGGMAQGLLNLVHHPR